MEPQVKPLFSGIGGRELIRICNEKMVCAARDLAEFTKNGINASFIVSLAHKCDSFEDRLEQIQQPTEIHDMEWEIKDSLKQICELGQAIWSHHPGKSQDYRLPVAQRSPADNRSPRVAS
jgi:hypothetical protein